MKNFIGYLTRHKAITILWCAALGLLFLINRLYGLPWGPATYIAILWTVMAIPVGLFAYWKEGKQLFQLRLLKNRRYPGDLPKTANPCQLVCYDLIRTLEQQLQEIKDHTRRESEKATRYYTLWSHQIKTPIAAMGLLLQEEEPDRRGLEQELFKIEQYVEMVLQYQRLGDSRDLIFQNYRVDFLAKQAVKRVATLFIHKKIALELSPIDFSVVTDEKWMVFVLEQLLTNAVKYTPAGCVSISLLPPSTLVIADTGIGIRPEDLPRVTEWGYTGLNGRMDKRSTGIGLSLCKQVLDMLGHGLRIESQVGKGTQVFLDLHREQFEIE